MSDSRIYDENGEQIYGGRGARSKRCREMIRLGLAYAKNDDGELQLIEPEESAPTVTDSAKQIRAAAEELADTLGVEITGYEVRMDVDNKTYIAELGAPQINVINGLTYEQLAEMANTTIGWVMSRGLSYHEYYELVEKVHRMLARHQLPRSVIQGVAPTIHDANADARSSLTVNQIPSNRSNICYDELWITPGLMPHGHTCHPHFAGVDEIHTETPPYLDEHSDMEHCRELWEGDAADTSAGFVCDNLTAAARSNCLNRGANKVVRIFLHWEASITDSVPSINYPNSPYFRYRNCLDRFIAHCSDLVHSGDNPDLRVVIYRPFSGAEEVNL